MSRGVPSLVLLVFVLVVGLVSLAFPCGVAQQISDVEFASRIPLPDGIEGPESIAFDARNQGPFTGVSDGRVLRWSDGDGWTPFAHHTVYWNNIEIMLNSDATARLMKYDPKTKQVTVLRAGLPYANGVAVSHDGSYVVVAHTGPCQAFRYWIAGARAGAYELFADLPGYPDNVRRDAGRGFWVALNREKVQLQPDPAGAAAAPAKHLVGVRLSGDGDKLEELSAADGVTLSEIVERGSTLWLGSVELSFIGLMRQD
uniref:Strictosidine synthase conserved region domain-containing protein n=1 Tax=Oryza brachyantha TaxID=4533 RepID=J3LTV5_ORYBR